MSFDKNYPNRKDWREPYRDVRQFDGSCRNHGSCPRCQGNRQHADKRRQPADLKEQVVEPLER